MATCTADKIPTQSTGLADQQDKIDTSGLRKLEVAAFDSLHFRYGKRLCTVRYRKPAAEVLGHLEKSTGLNQNCFTFVVLVNASACATPAIPPVRLGHQEWPKPVGLANDSLHLNHIERL
jgi:hypothetical protein